MCGLHHAYHAAEIGCGVTDDVFSSVHWHLAILAFLFFELVLTFDELALEAGSQAFHAVGSVVEAE